MKLIYTNPQHKIRAKSSGLLSKFEDKEKNYNFCRIKIKYINIIFSIFIYHKKIILIQVIFCDGSPESKR